MQKTADQHQNDSGCISGLALQVRLDSMDEVVSTISDFDGVEVHIIDPTGKLIITIEENAGEKIMIDTITRIGQVQGVISTALAYTHHAA
ncbi:MAG: chaperone NapD [Endozoicomonas sp.]